MYYSIIASKKTRRKMATAYYVADLWRTKCIKGKGKRKKILGGSGERERERILVGVVYHALDDGRGRKTMSAV